MGKILLVDDDRLTQVMVGDALREAGHEVVVRGGAWGTTQVVHDEMPDVILLDLGLPTIGGEEFLELIRQNRHFDQIKIILYSGRERLGEVAETIGADGFVKKGPDLGELVRKIERYLPRGS